MSDAELKETYQAITGAWELIKNYREVKDDEEFWHRCIIDLSELEAQNYAAEQFGIAAMSVLEHYYRKRLEERRP